MAGFYRYGAVFETTILPTPIRIIIDPVAVEVFKGPKSYQIPYQQRRVLAAGEALTISHDINIELPEGTYIEVVARTKERNPINAQTECKEAVDRMIAVLSLLHSPNIFNRLVYEGWLLEDGKAIMQAWVKMVNKRDLEKDLLIETAEGLSGVGDKDLLARFDLMSKFYSKALLYDPGEEKFLFLWTILEVFPMMGTAKYRPIADYLAPLIGRPAAEVADTLQVKGMHDLRSKLVHSGKFDLGHQEMAELIDKTEAIVHTVMRAMAGLEYDQSLETYFQ